jgi:hypothetical protein
MTQAQRAFDAVMIGAFVDRSNDFREETAQAYVDHCGKHFAVATFDDGSQLVKALKGGQTHIDHLPSK